MAGKSALTFLVALSIIVAVPAKAEDDKGASCTLARLKYCRKKFNFSGFGPAFLQNHCSRSPSGAQYEYLATAWRCLQDY